MNHDLITEELFETLRGIKAGKPWQYEARWVTSGWVDAGKTSDPFSCLSDDGTEGGEPVRIRLRPEPKMIPLDVGDIVPGMVFRFQNAGFKTVIEVRPDWGVLLGSNKGFTGWLDLQNNYYVSQNGINWVKCEKVAP